MAFRYCQLDPTIREIRLLRIDPISPSHSNVVSSFHSETSQPTTTTLTEPAIQCRIERVSLNDDPEYIALSYCWGEPARTCALQLDGSTSLVTNSLYGALLELRQENRRTPIWADALCINQEDEVEKSWQVQQMRAIYQKAVMVFVWLGPPSSSSHLAMSTLDKIGREASEYLLPKFQRDEQIGFTDNFKGSNNRLMDMLSCGQDDRASVESVLDSVRLLIKRPWWQRIWVIQELASTKHAIFACGHERVKAWHLFLAWNWFNLYHAIELAQGVPVMIEGSTPSRQLSYLELDGRPSVLFNIAFTNGLGKLKLLDLLQKTRVCDRESLGGFKATDPRDLVFALLGIAKDAEELGIRPNYAKSCEEVFTATTVTFLERGDLSILTLCQSPRRLDGLPSWVPDWSSSLKSTMQGVLRFFSASGNHEASPRIDRTRSNTLSLTGILFDVVHSVGNIRPKIETYLENPSEGFQALSHWHRDCAVEFTGMVFRLGHVNYGASENFPDAVWRTMIMDLEETNDGQYCRVRSPFRQAFDILLKSPIHGDWRTQYDTATVSLVDRYHTLVTERLEGRRSFMLQNGYIGLGPQNLQAGDLVAVLLGASVPFLLRKDENGNFRVVGEAYVHGIMDGQCVAGNPVIDTFTLC
jgi:hypothetical protein